MVNQSFLSPPSGVECSTKVEAIISSKDFDCRIESGFSWNIITAPPTADEIKATCQSATCLRMLDSLKATSGSECVTQSGWYLNADLVNPILKGCVPTPAPGVKCVDALEESIFSNAGTCTADSGYSFWVIQASPTPDQVTSLCQRAACRTLIESMRRVAPTECVYTGFYLYADLAPVASYVMCVWLAKTQTKHQQRSLKITTWDEPYARLNIQ